MITSNHSIASCLGTLLPLLEMYHLWSGSATLFSSNPQLYTYTYINVPILSILIILYDTIMYDFMILGSGFLRILISWDLMRVGLPLVLIVKLACFGALHGAPKQARSTFFNILQSQINLEPFIKYSFDQDLVKVNVELMLILIPHERMPSE